MAGNQNATFKIEDMLLKKLRDYAYTERITITEAVNRALRLYLSDKTGLMEKPLRGDSGGGGNQGRDMAIHG